MKRRRKGGSSENSLSFNSIERNKKNEKETLQRSKRKKANLEGDCEIEKKRCSHFHMKCRMFSLLEFANQYT